MCLRIGPNIAAPVRQHDLSALTRRITATSEYPRNSSRLLQRPRPADVWPTVSSCGARAGAARAFCVPLGSPPQHDVWNLLTAMAKLPTDLDACQISSDILLRLRKIMRESLRTIHGKEWEATGIPPTSGSI